MTAVNIVKRRDEVRFITDGAAYDSQGYLKGIASKIHALPHLNTVMVGRGPALASEMIAFHLGHTVQSFDYLVLDFERLFSDLVDRYELLELSAFTLYIAGFSERRNAFEIYMTATRLAVQAGKARIDDRDIEPGKLIELGEDHIAPIIAVSRILEVFDPPPSSVEGFVGDDDGCVALLELQREQKFDGSAPCVVGGFGQLTILRRDSVETRIICRWPDVIGDKVTAAPFDWAAFGQRWKGRQAGTHTVVPLSRAERRRRESEQRRSRS